jgi:hypothetical protein
MAGAGLSGLVGRMQLATQAAISAWRRTYNNPADVEGGAVQSRASWYLLLWSYYDNSAFEDVRIWAGYKGVNKLYRQMRSLYNPTRRLVDFYAAQVYPGVLSLDGKSLPDGVQIAIPFAEDTDPALQAAIAQFWRWTGWQNGKGVMVRWAAATGNVLVEIIDDVDDGKVTANVTWPGNLAALDLDAAGNVRGYALQYEATDEKNIRYIYRKEVDAAEYRFFKDGVAFDYGEGASYPNPYTFVPAVWVKHRDLGGDYGAPAIHGSLGKVDELNSIASHVHDQVHKLVENPVLIASSGRIGRAGEEQAQTKRPTTTDFDNPPADREGVRMYQGPADTRVMTLAGSLDPSAVIPHMDKLLAEIEMDHPEVTLYRELRGMSQVTGPAAARLMGDVGGKLVESAANYDAASVRIFQMAVSIAGWRANRGDWGFPLTRHQQLFLPFDLGSYARGDLDFDIAPRPLLPTSDLERIQVEQAQLGLDQLRAAAVAPQVLITEKSQA